MKKTGILLFVVALSQIFLHSSSAYAERQKILYVDSYHAEYQWSADLTDGVESVLAGRKDVELKIFRMDTKRNKSEEFKKAAALRARDLIESWKPDVVIASDDNASKYLIAPYYKGKDLPFVFCGLNWRASAYGFPAKNVTGMIEITLYKSGIEYLFILGKGERIGVLASDTLTERKEVKNITDHFQWDMNVRFVKTFDELKQAFLDLQQESDVMLIMEIESVDGFDHQQMVEFVNQNASVPTAGFADFTKHYAVFVLARSGQEQGEYAAKTALDILAGKSPREIPIAVNKRSRVFLNMKLARKLGIKFPMELIESAHLVSAEQKKLLFVSSYHTGYQWSDDIEKGLLKALSITVNQDGSYDTSQSEVQLRVVGMDTKRNTSVEFKQQAALAAKRIIDQWQPDVVVASDDNAAKYLIAPYYKNAATPFIFCGLNWDASVYGFPVSNVTGMVEITPLLDTLETIKPYARGNRIGYIGKDVLSARKTFPYYERLLGRPFTDGKLVSTFEEFKQAYLRLQDSVDVLLWMSPIGISGWDERQAEDFILANTKIPSGGLYKHTVRYVLLARTNIAEEQGWWAGKTALRILDGTSPADIPLTRNKESRLYLNMHLADHLGIKFPMDLIEKATLVEELPEGR